jgi:protocatechuate 3,4-dioxygenase beta subunit
MLPSLLMFMLLAQVASTAPTVRISGRVVVESQRGAAAAVELKQLRLSIPRGRSFSAAVGSDGFFEFGGVPPGNYELTAVRFSFPPMSINVSGADIANVQFVIPLVPVIGRVLDPEGNPVPDARVEIVSGNALELAECRGDFASDKCDEAFRKQRLLDGEARSGFDGRFSIPIPGGLTNDDYLRVDGRDARGVSLQNSWPIGPNRKLFPPDMGDVSLYRWRELIIAVRADGRPVPDAELDFGSGIPRRTDQRGEMLYGFHAPSEDSLSGIGFSVRAPGFAVEARNPGIPAGSTRMDVDLVKDAALQGRVLDSAGQPLRDATVTVRPAEAWIITTRPRDHQIDQVRTDADGHFVARGLSPNHQYRISAEPPTRLPMSQVDLVVKGGAAPLEVTLPAAGEVLIDGEYPPSAETSYDRTALERVWPGRINPVGLERLDARTGHWTRVNAPMNAEQAQRGTFRLRFSQVPAGALRVVAEGTSNVADDASDPFAVTAGVTTPVRLRLVMFRTLRLRVVDEAGAPVSEARVEWALPQADAGSYADTDEAGFLDIKVHPSRDLQVKVTASGGREIHVTIPAGTEKPAPIVLDTK